MSKKFKFLLRKTICSLLVTGFTSTLPRRTKETFRSSSRLLLLTQSFAAPFPKPLAGAAVPLGGVHPADPGVLITRRPSHCSGKPWRLRARPQRGKPTPTPTPPRALGASRNNPLGVGCQGQRHTAPQRRRQGAVPTRPGRATLLPLRPRPLAPQRAAPDLGPLRPTPPPQGSRDQGQPPAAGHVHPRSDTRPRPARGSRGSSPARKARPRPGRRHLRPRPRAMFEKEKERARGQARPARPAIAHHPRRAAAHPSLPGPASPPPPPSARGGTAGDAEQRPPPPWSRRHCLWPGPARPPPLLSKPRLAPPPPPRQRPRFGPL